ncbi:MAG: hypothetical protein ACC653_13015 [Gammaproteobacteria bacterium]
MDLDSLTIPDWVNWIAQDADGVIWGYEVEPIQHHQGWYENEVGRSINLAKQSVNTKWHESITKIR